MGIAIRCAPRHQRRGAMSSFPGEVLEPVILHEQPNQGRTIITKFREEAGGVAFAVVLMTPDDLGGPASGEPSSYRHRARQNVIFELGFFAGALGLERVCALMLGDIERPSDIDGLLYVSYNGDWKVALLRELNAAKVPLNMNGLL